MLNKCVLRKIVFSNKEKKSYNFLQFVKWNVRFTPTSGSLTQTDCEPQRTHNLRVQTCPRPLSVQYQLMNVWPHVWRAFRRPVDGPRGGTSEVMALVGGAARSSAVLLLHWQGGWAVHISQFISGSESNAMEVSSAASSCLQGHWRPLAWQPSPSTVTAPRILSFPLFFSFSVFHSNK